MLFRSLLRGPGESLAQWDTRRMLMPSQFSDPQLAASYNLIALDGRCSGQTVGGEVATYTLEVRNCFCVWQTFCD